MFHEDFNVRKHALERLPGLQLKLYAYDMASVSLPHYEKTEENPNPRKYIEYLKKHLNKEIGDEELQQVHDEIFATIRFYQYEMSESFITTVLHAVSASLSHRSHLPGDTVATNASYASFSAANVISYSHDCDFQVGWDQVTEIYNQAQPNVPFPEYYKTPDTQALAQEILNNNFTLMPLLADALMDLGADNTDLVRNGKAYSNWALYHLRNTESRYT